MVMKLFLNILLYDVEIVYTTNNIISTDRNNHILTNNFTNVSTIYNKMCHLQIKLVDNKQN